MFMFKSNVKSQLRMKRRKFKEVKKIKYQNNNEVNCETCNCGLENIFPDHLPLYLFVIILSLRVYYVLQPINWWLLHPDEVFQSVEVAFSEVYGYGFRTYEYCPPLINITNAVEEQEERQGMYSLRSFIYPQFFTVVFSLCKYFGIRTNSYVVGRISQSVVTSFLPVSVFKISKTLFKCQGVAFLSAILASFSLHFNVLGTHAIINSFISPFLFFVLDVILQNVLSKDELSESHVKADKVKRSEENLLNCVSENSQGLSNEENVDINDNHKNNAISSSDTTRQRKIITYETASVKTGIPVKSAKDKTKKNGKSWRWKYDILQSVSLVFSGIISAIICYVRPDSSIFLIEFSCSILYLHRSSVSVNKFFYLLFTIGCGFTIGLGICGAIDFYTYGTWFISPLQWARLNIWSHVPGILYGTHGPYQYVFDIFASCKSDFCFYVFCAIVLFVMFVQSHMLDSEDTKSFSSLLLTLILVLFVYSLVGHKEIRFVHSILIVINILAAYAIHGTLQYINSIRRLAKEMTMLLIAILIGFVAFGTYWSFPRYQKQIALPWNTVTPSDSSDINQCLDFIGRQKDVSGVFMDGSIYMTAGFSILNHDVPIITLVHHEYHEYRPGVYKPRDDLLYTAPKHLHVINRYSDIIDVSNIHYLSKRLLESQEYNFIIIPTRRFKSFNQLGYQNNMFTTGRYSVLSRSTSKEQKRALIELGQKMTPGNNVTVVEYEASWLFTSGLYSKAIERLEYVIKISGERIRPFQILSASYAHLEDFDSAKATEDKCIARHSRVTCRQPQQRIVIHHDYESYSVD